MVAGTAVAAITIATAGATAPVIAAATFGSGAGISAGFIGTASAVGGAVGGSVAGGAIAGAASGSLAGAGVGALVGGSSAAGVGGATIWGAALASGPIGWLVLGTTDESRVITFDCWKPVVHETSPEPSNGMLLKDLVEHPKIASVNITEDDHAMDNLPDIVITNVWDEKFHVDYLRIIETNEIVCHARPLLA